MLKIGLVGLVLGLITLEKVWFAPPSLFLYQSFFVLFILVGELFASLLV